MNIQKWDYVEIELEGPDTGNPFTDIEVTGRFSIGNRTVSVDGFYDGNGIYKIRFMPDRTGIWNYRAAGNAAELNEKTGSFTCIEPEPGNHGPVRIRHTHHLEYEDGTAHFSFGTTCYAWVHQPEAEQEQTLRTLKTSPFNKLRMCVFPKWYPFNRVEPEHYPFEGNPPDRWDFSKFNPDFFRHIEKRILQLREMGIEADLILFHPYDDGHWRFDRMTAEEDDRYLRYIIARFSAFRNVWWSLANEFDLMEKKSDSDWDRFFKIIQEKDPVQHMRGVHNCNRFYDHGKPWVTHCSIQHSEMNLIPMWQDQYGKPVIIDECRYEGNIGFNWGNITAKKMTDQFWKGIILGGYAGHGETYKHPDDKLWWSKGGELRGESPERIRFLRELIEKDFEEGAFSVLEPLRNKWNDSYYCFDQPNYYLTYFDLNQQLAEKTIDLPEDREYTIHVIDCWEMTITALGGTFSGKVTVELPGKPMTAIRAKAVKKP
jgi:hypothetical protein